MGLVMGFWFVLVPTLVIAAGIWLFIRLFGGSKNQAGDDEARIIQECYERLDQMERRVESLETLLLDATESRRRRDEAET